MLKTRIPAGHAERQLLVQTRAAATAACLLKDARWIAQANSSKHSSPSFNHEHVESGQVAVPRTGSRNQDLYCAYEVLHLRRLRRLSNHLYHDAAAGSRESLAALLVHVAQLPDHLQLLCWQPGALQHLLRVQEAMQPSRLAGRAACTQIWLGELQQQQGPGTALPHEQGRAPRFSSWRQT